MPSRYSEKSQKQRDGEEAIEPMSRKDYVLLQTALFQSRPLDPQLDAGYMHAVSAIADALAADNPTNFARDHFMEVVKGLKPADSDPRQRE